MEFFRLVRILNLLPGFFVTNANLVTYKVLFDHVIVIITSLRTIFLHFSVRTGGVKSQLWELLFFNIFSYLAVAYNLDSKQAMNSAMQERFFE